MTAIYSYEDSAESFLEGMRLSGTILQEGLQRGLAQRHNATPFHPPTAPGTFMHYGLVHAVRELLVPCGWEFAEKDGLSYTFHPELLIALIVSSGNSYVGDRMQNPSFKYPKGPTTQAAIAGNASQLGLFDGIPGWAESVLPSTSMRTDFDTFKTWWLLHYVDLSKRVMRAELSLPVRVGNDGDINQWVTRIILAPVSFDDGPDVDRTDNVPNGPDFDVEVRKKD